MKLSKIYRLLHEVGDLSKIDSYPFNVMALTTEFQTELDTVKVEFHPIDFKNSIEYPPALILQDNIKGYNIQYSVSNIDTQYRKSDYTYLIKILKTVTDIIIETITKNDQKSGDKLQNIYCIGSISKIGNITQDRQKDMIYKMIAKNHLPNGYRLSDIEFKDVGIKGIAVTKNKLK